MSRLALIATVIFSAACAAPDAEPAEDATEPDERLEGVWEYLPPTQGQSIAHGGRFVFLYGPADGSRPMTGESGNYEISGDTVKNTIQFSTNPDRIGIEYWWMVESASGDTVNFVLMNPEGEVTGGGGRSVQIR
jgi:hypothetical protein